MQKIFFLSVMNGGAWGGSEELWFQVARWAAQNGFEVGVACFDWPGKRTRLEQLEQAGCKLFLLPGKSSTRKPPFFAKLKLQKAVAQLPLESYDSVIISQGGWKDITHAPFRKLYERLRHYSILYHNYNDNAPYSVTRAQALQHWVDQAFINLGDTPKIFQAIENSYRIHVPRQGKLYNPLSFATPATLTPYPALQNGNYILSVFAALDVERKAQDVLIRTLALSHWKNENWQLHLYGEGKDRERLQELINTNQLQDKVFLKGNAPDYRAAVCEAHIVLQITHIDAMPITVMDALAMGRPLIVSQTGDMPSWVIPGINGWITDDVTMDAIDKSLREAWALRTKWQDMGAASFELFKRQFPEAPLPYFMKQVGLLS